MPILVSDFDGTLTGRDYFELILERHRPPAAQAVWEGFKAGRLTHFEAIAGVFGALPGDLAGAEALVGELEPPPGLAAAVHRLQDAGWELQIASAGCGWYIERFLARLGIEAVFHACPGEFIEGKGLVMRPATGSPFASASEGIDKPAVVRAALARDPVVAVAGDSGTDHDGMLLVPPERRFARRWLADALRAEGEGFHAFGQWPEIVDVLLEEPAG
jgi:HAD superfamily phosphoserine phosphatase-like hydrolase